MVAPFAKVMPSKVTMAVVKFVVTANPDFKDLMTKTIKEEIENDVSLDEIALKLKLTYFMATVPAVLTEKTVELGMAPYLLRLFALQIEKVDWRYLVDRLLQKNSPELN